MISNWPRSAIALLLVAGSAGVMTWAELSTTSTILAFHRQVVLAGANVVVASESTGIPADDCTSLNARPEVLSAGAVYETEPARLSTAPQTQFTTVGITAGTISVWDASVGTPETLLHDELAVGGAVAAELGLKDGMYVGVGDNDPKRVSVLNVGVRHPSAMRWVIVPVAPVGSADSCWVEFRPGSATGGLALMAVALAEAGPEMTLRPLVRLDEFARDPVAELKTRSEAQAWAAAGVGLTLTFWLMIWFRRSEFALYRILGSTRWALWFHLQTETLLLVVVGAAVGGIWAATLYEGAASPLPQMDQYLVAGRSVSSMLLLMLILGPVPALLMGNRRSLLSLLSE